MSVRAAKPSRWGVLRRLCVWTVVFTILLYALAHTPLIVFAQQQARGTGWEGPLWRWHLSIHGRKVEKALARGEIHAGQRVEDVIATHGPFDVRNLGRFQTLGSSRLGAIEFEGYRIIAKDGIISAAVWWTCVGHVVFFDATTPEDHEEFGREREAEAARIEQEWRAVHEARMAVGGVGAYTEPHTQSQPLPE